MPDLPTPKDAAEAALFSECWDTVLSYADLCTSGSEAANRLAREAFADGMREGPAAPTTDAVRGAGRRVARLPRIPRLLTAVRDTAAAWEARGQGHRLDPDLRLWLTSEQAARYTGPPLGRPLAPRTLRDMQPADAELLWLAEVEALPLAVVARRLRLDPAGIGAELAEARALFRDRCLRNHLDSPMTAECRGYARMLDALTRDPGADAPDGPDDLSQHLARCVRCAEAAACLRPHGGGLPAALAGGVIGWGGLAYLERRRRAADVRLGPAHPTPADPEPEPVLSGAHKARVLRNGLLVAAVLVSALALAVSLMPGGTSDHAATDPGDGSPVADPRPSLPGSARPGATTDRGPSPTPEKTPRPTKPPEKTDPNPRPEPQGTATLTPPAPAPTAVTPPAAHPAPETAGTTAACRVDYDLTGQWPDGFQATVTVTTAHALDDWRLTWSFRDGQRVNQMWDAGYVQEGTRVTATAAHYNGTVPAGGTLALGFIASWDGTNSPGYDFELNGRGCVNA
ncbi:cellulose binding domain-containing protein [Streptomyces sp. NPDC057877]|uniref:cellulose binding domain-containing protein n=1 Tax=Streptomyces sp. NPDC057877 TaxID=3346269 RepID=UPI0036CE306E